MAAERSKFQIRDERFGLALYPAETATEALMKFIAVLALSVDGSMITVEDGVASVEYQGQTYRAVPQHE
jgi:hypothetical protein